MNFKKFFKKSKKNRKKNSQKKSEKFLENFWKSLILYFSHQFWKLPPTSPHARAELAYNVRKSLFYFFEFRLLFKCSRWFCGWLLSVSFQRQFPSAHSFCYSRGWAKLWAAPWLLSYPKWSSTYQVRVLSNISPEFHDLTLDSGKGDPLFVGK